MKLRDGSAGEVQMGKCEAGLALFCGRVLFESLASKMG